MKVNFYANLREITGGKSVELDLPREKVVELFGKAAGDLFDEDSMATVIASPRPPVKKPAAPPPSEPAAEEEDDATSEKAESDPRH